eukprot:GSMAST32.ASY1.ANO1.1339.1 assembled CDS
MLAHTYRRCHISTVAKRLFCSHENITKFPIPPALASTANITVADYAAQYASSVDHNSDDFWASEARKRLQWSKDFTVPRSTHTNCIDRHGDDCNDSRHITYSELLDEVSRVANVLKEKFGIVKGDRVSICMPMIPETAVAIIVDCKSKLVITADVGMRGGKPLELIPASEESVESVLVVNRLHNSTGRDIWYHDAIQCVSNCCPAEAMNAEDPLFILYTSGSTGKPKGVLHSSAGYLLGASLTHDTSFDHKEGDIFWCTADCGWITGHTLYGPLCNGGTTVMFEGIPMYPTPARFWEIIDRYGINCIYTAPTAIRALMAEGDEYVTKTSRKSLRVLGTVGEPINSSAWHWYKDTGCHMLTPLPDPETGVVLEGNPVEGSLVINGSWPSQLRTIYGDQSRFEGAYYGDYPGKYFTGDCARRDADGYYWITGRTDDVINVSGHRLGTAEVETAIMTHSSIAKAAVVGFPHSVKGTAIYAFVVPNNTDDEMLDESTLTADVKSVVRKVIGPIASPDKIQISRALPETRSGKTMRRILRKVAEGEDNIDAFGDTSTLLDESVVLELISNRQ